MTVSRDEPVEILARLKEMAVSNYEIVRVIQKAIIDSKELPDPKMIMQLKELSNSARLAYGQYYKMKGYEEYDPVSEEDGAERKKRAAKGLFTGTWKE